MPRHIQQQRVDAIAADLEGATPDQKKTTPRGKRKPVVCKAAFVESESTWDYLEETYDLLQEFNTIPSM